MRVLGVLAGLALLAGLLVLGRGSQLASVLPWSAGCTLRDEAGTVLLEGSVVQVAEAVQRALAEGDEAVTDALAAGPTLACRIPPMRATDAPKEPPLGLTPNAEQVRDEVRETFGDVPDGGFGPEAVLPGRRAGGAHSEGRAIDFFFRPYEDADQAAAGWQLANWSVANAERLGIRTVIYRDRIWTAFRSAQGWRDYRFGGPDPDNPINRHLDHVHLDVA